MGGTAALAASGQGIDEVLLKVWGGVVFRLRRRVVMIGARIGIADD